MKKCIKCKLSKELEMFAIKGKGRSSVCKLCHKEYTKKHYQNNKDLYKSRAAARGKIVKKKIKILLRGLLLERGCIDCGNNNPLNLDFDHVRGSKSIEVGRLINNCPSLETLFEEVDKCEIRCANCHRIVTSERRICASMGKLVYPPVSKTGPSKEGCRFESY